MSKKTRIYIGNDDEILCGKNGGNITIVLRNQNIEMEITEDKAKEVVDVLKNFLNGKKNSFDEMLNENRRIALSPLPHLVESEVKRFIFSKEYKDLMKRQIMQVLFDKETIALLWDYIKAKEEREKCR